MAACRGAAFIFLLLLLLRLVSSLDSDDPAPLLDRHEAQLRRLEALVDSLSETVSALQSSLSPSRSFREPPRFDAGHVPPPSSGVAVTKHKPLWSERFQFAAAARLEPPSAAAAAVVLPYEDLDGISKYFAVGDSRGHVYVFSVTGDVLLELPLLADSPVTTMLAYLSPRRRECLLFAGHADGSISAHRLLESSAVADDWLILSAVSSRLFVRGLDASPVLILELHMIGRARYIVTCDDSGRIRVFTENGTLYGTAIASSRPLAFMGHRLLFLTEAGAGSLDLRSMAIRETDCEGLNGSVPISYSFDSSERSKAYGYTTGGDLVHVVLLGDTANLKCRVRSVQRSEIDGPVAIQTIKGYLLVASHDKVFVYNISSQYYGRVGAPRPLFFTSLQEIRSVFVNPDVSSSVSLVGRPLIAAGREKIVVLGLGDGYVAVYRSKFPVFRAENNAVVWSGPVLLFLLFLIGLWQFYVKKKDSLEWAPEESFSTSAATTGSLLNHTASDRAYADSTRSGDLRGGALRGVPRRYVSPPHYAGSSGIPYRPVSADPGLRGPAELKYRGQGIEPSGFGKNRDPLFPNAPIVDNHVD